MGFEQGALVLYLNMFVRLGPLSCIYKRYGMNAGGISSSQREAEAAQTPHASFLCYVSEVKADHNASFP